MKKFHKMNVIKNSLLSGIIYGITTIIAYNINHNIQGEENSMGMIALVYILCYTIAFIFIILINKAISSNDKKSE